MLRCALRAGAPKLTLKSNAAHPYYRIARRHFPPVGGSHVWPREQWRHLCASCWPCQAVNLYWRGACPEGYAGRSACISSAGRPDGLAAAPQRDCWCRSVAAGEEGSGFEGLSGFRQQTGCENAGVAGVFVARPAGPPP
eukprot:scaffold3076_cov117-Isochrysis_galbana.AAC.11